MEITKEETWLIERARKFNKATRFRRFMGRIIPPVIIAIVVMEVRGYLLARCDNPQSALDILILCLLGLIILFPHFIGETEETIMRLIEKQYEQIKKLEEGKKR